MVWTYVDTLATPRDQIRWFVGDTDTNEQLVSDGEITYASTQNPDVRLAAAEVADAISRKFARQPNVRTQDTTVDYTARAKQYRDLAMALREQYALRGAVPFAGGISIADKDTREEDTDRVLPGFTRGLHGTPGLWPETTEEDL